MVWFTKEQSYYRLIASKQQKFTKTGSQSHLKRSHKRSFLEGALRDNPINGYVTLCTLSTSPRCTRSTLITCSLVTFIVPGCNLTKIASEGCNDKSLARASEVFPFATCSIQRPREMNTNNMGGVSKKVMGLWLLCSAMATATTTIWKKWQG